MIKKIFNAVFFIALLCLVAGTGIYAGYNAINIKENKPVSNPLLNTIGKSQAQVMADTGNITESVAKQAETPKTNADTRLVLEYLYSDGSDSKTQEQSMPEFLRGKSEEDFMQSFTGWKVQDFGEEKVVLERLIPRKIRQKYKISVVDGYVAVFYDEGIDGSKLKEVTDMPISSLPKEEGQRLTEGIEVIGEESLINILQDFGS
jgi:hypothetical protein